MEYTSKSVNLRICVHVHACVYVRACVHMCEMKACHLTGGEMKYILSSQGAALHGIRENQSLQKRAVPSMLT